MKLRRRWSILNESTKTSRILRMLPTVTLVTIRMIFFVISTMNRKKKRRSDSNLSWSCEIENWSLWKRWTFSLQTGIGSISRFWNEAREKKKEDLSAQSPFLQSPSYTASPYLTPNPRSTPIKQTKSEIRLLDQILEMPVSAGVPPKPTILVPNTSESILNMLNIREFLQFGEFKPWRRFTMERKLLLEWKGNCFWNSGNFVIGPLHHIEIFF